MSLADQRKLDGRQPFTQIEWDLPYCAEVYATAPCTAILGTTGADRCYNTRNHLSDCQDTANFNPATKTHKFCSIVANHPIGLDYIPCVSKISNVADGEIDPGKSMGRRISRRIVLQDMPYHDRGVDKYWDLRSYDAESQGTLFGKLIARNPFYEGSVIRIKEGYLTTPYDSTLFETRTYVVDHVDFKADTVTITVTDFLRLADSAKAKAPVLSQGSLLADITDSATSATLIPAGIGNSEYGASGRLRIDKELMDYTRTADALILTRAVGGTSAESHSAGGVVQECYVVTDTNIVDIVYELLNTYVGIDAAYLPLATSWAAEKDLWLSTANVDRTISEPTSVFALLAEITQEFNVNFWWNDRTQIVELKANMPLAAGVTANTLTEKFDFVDIKIKEINKDRVTQVWVLWGLRDLTKIKDNNDYANWYINPVAENLYTNENIKIIQARWISSEGQAAGLAGRWQSRYKKAPKRVTFTVDAKNADIAIGDIKYLDTQEIPNATGASENHRVQVIAVSEVVTGDKFAITTLSSYFTSRYGFITQSGAPDYSAASDAEKLAGCYISEAGGANFSDGTEPYRMP